MPRLALLSRLRLSAALAVAASDIGAAQQAAGVFTVEQARLGRAVYDRNCAACHGFDLEGSGDAPALGGGAFMLKWGPKMVSEVFGLILQSMPPANPRSLGEEAALHATAYILQRNGAPTGQQALSAGVTTRIDMIATGRVLSAGVQARGRGRRCAIGATI